MLDIFVWAGAIIPVLFFVHYTWVMRVKWWRTVNGRCMIALDFALWIIVAPLAVSLADPRYVHHHSGDFTWSIVAGLGLAPMVVSYRMIAFERMRRRRGRRAGFESILVDTEMGDLPLPPA